jgi:hypothetical protein
MKWHFLTIILVHLAYQNSLAQSSTSANQSSANQWGITLDLPVEYQFNGYPGDISLAAGLGCWYQWRSLRFYTGFRILAHNYTQLPDNWSSEGSDWINFDVQLPLSMTYFAISNQKLALGPFVQADWRPRYEFYAYSNDYQGYWSHTDPFQVMGVEQLAVRPPGWGFAEGIHLVFKPQASNSLDLQLGMQHNLLKQEVSSKISAYTGNGFEYINTNVKKRLPTHSLLLNIQLNFKI